MGTGSSKKESKNAAAREMVELLLTGDPVEESTAEEFESSSSNPVSVLMEYAAKGKSLRPDFVLLDSDSNGSFRTKCTLVLTTGSNDAPTIEGIGSGSRIQISKTKSAQVVLQQLREKGYLSRGSSFQVSSEVNSSVGELIPTDAPGCSSVDKSQVGNEARVESERKPEEKEKDDSMQELTDYIRSLMKDTVYQMGVASGSSRQQGSEESSTGATGNWEL